MIRVAIERAQEMGTRENHVERDIYSFIHEQPFALPRETRLDVASPMFVSTNGV
jgi:hypothetical protein